MQAICSLILLSLSGLEGDAPVRWPAPTGADRSELRDHLGTNGAPRRAHGNPLVRGAHRVTAARALTLDVAVALARGAGVNAPATCIGRIFRGHPGRDIHPQRTVRVLAQRGGYGDQVGLQLDAGRRLGHRSVETQSGGDLSKALG